VVVLGLHRHEVARLQHRPEGLQLPTKLKTHHHYQYHHHHHHIIIIIIINIIIIIIIIIINFIIIIISSLSSSSLSSSSSSSISSSYHHHHHIITISSSSSSSSSLAYGYLHLQPITINHHPATRASYWVSGVSLPSMPMSVFLLDSTPLPVGGISCQLIIRTYFQFVGCQQ